MLRMGFSRTRISTARLRDLQPRASSCSRQKCSVRGVSSSANDRYSGYETTFARLPSVYGWRYHLDNTIQFILWAAFGSAAIHLLNIKQKYAEKERRLSTKIALLKDIIRRVGEGEDVDIARELKVGKTEEEREWEEVMDSFREDAGLPPDENEVVDRDGTDTPELAPTSLVGGGPSHISTNKEVDDDTRPVKSTWFWR